MKPQLRKLFWPILSLFETDAPPTHYRPSHRTILNVVGTLFMLLSLGSASAVIYTGQLEAILPVIVFFCIGSVALIVGALGSDGAVSRIWGKR
ncbi:hypothetical protein [Motiliproteus sp. SC1-56]|uniref:hypothetical protein n=1 Tax=Motiliproteus sp. SC1-56 TaxID=2799565 RepID=UPI001A90563C|nr:hypothetical protein [Motiliproteus sp. SC1-56]